MLPAFHGEKMQRLSGLMERGGRARGRRAGRSDEPIALHPRLQALTLEIILRAVFGLDPGDAARRAPRAAHGHPRLRRAAAPRCCRCSSAAAGGRPVRARSRDEADALIFELIDERRASGGEDRDDVLAMLLAARHEDGSPMSPVELRDELMTLLVAGHETTASELAWAFERLARTPGVLDAARPTRSTPATATRT